MARRSRLYRSLEKELKLLSRQFLPIKFSATGSYPDRVYRSVLAYRVLAHAEFEYYLEERVRELYLNAIRAWQAQKQISKILSSMVAFSGVEMEKPPETKVPQNSNQAGIWSEKLTLSARITKAGNILNFAIERNHGVKEKNILRLLLPIGLDADDIDNVWLATINSFGEERGMVAHKSRIAYKRPSEN